MNVGEIISDSIRYPSSDWKKYVILGVLLVIPIIFFIALGYILRIIKSSIAGYSELPEFDDLGDLFIDGLKVFIVTIVYNIIPLIVIIVGLFGSIAAVGGVANITNYPLAFAGLLGVTVIIVLILAVIFAIFEIIAIANMAYYDELGAAFKFSEILDRMSKIGWGKYIIWFIAMIIIGIITVIISGIITSIPIIGYIISTVFIFSYYYMFLGRSTALIFIASEETQKKSATSRESIEEPEKSV
ncbi:MAG: DUF4013 domain-containing protein [Methanobacterium sp.]|jgi:hypothetical protein